jgi:hypothetical protein
MSQNLAAALSTERAVKIQHGEPTGDIDFMIEKDPSRPGRFRLTKELLKQRAADVAQADVDKAKALGLHWAMQDDAVKKREDERVREWNTPSAGQRLTAGSAQARMAAQATQRSIQNADRQRSLAQTDARFDAAIQNKDYDIAAANARVLNAQVGSAKTNLNSTVNTLNNMSEQFRNDNPTLVENLVSQATADQSIVSKQSSYSAAIQAAGQRRADAMALIRGNPGSTVNVAPPSISVNVATPGAAPGTQYGGHQYKIGSEVPGVAGAVFVAQNPDGSWKIKAGDRTGNWKP